MIRAEPIVMNDFQVNTYLVWDDTGDCLVVDPAFYSQEDQEKFEKFLSDRELTLTSQIHTHCHVDHLLGVAYIRERFGFPLRAHPEEAKIAAGAPLMAEMFGWSMAAPGEIDERIGDNDRIAVGEHLLEALHVPGHSPGSMAFYSSEGGFVITGDALFRGSIGRTDLPGGDYDTLIRSIRERLLSLPDETVAYPGHGPATTIGEERTGNPFLATAS